MSVSKKLITTWFNKKVLELSKFPRTWNRFNPGWRKKVTMTEIVKVTSVEFNLKTDEEAQSFLKSLGVRTGSIKTIKEEYISSVFDEKCENNC